MTRSLLACVIALIVNLGSRGADDDQWSTVKGKVVFDDSKTKIPVRVVPPSSKAADLPACAAKDKDFLTEEWIVDPKTKGVRDAFVWLAPEPTADQWKAIKTKGP